ncbi:putative polyketide biosynthesis enoyl-CoA hydratase PksH [compost metagenome]
MNYQTLQVRYQGPICFIRFHRPEANNTINDRFVQECLDILTICEDTANVVVLEGLPEVFCFGADFQELQEKWSSRPNEIHDPEPLYRVWLKLALGPYVSVAHVRGKVNAGGIGFVAASDIVLADETAQFSLSEMLFGLYPACVLPFLTRRVGFQRAHYLTLTTQQISAPQAAAWGLVDAYEAQSDGLLRKHLLRLRRLSKTGITSYKAYAASLDDGLQSAKVQALNANKMMFSEPRNQEGIMRYVNTGKFPWEDE